MKMRMYSLSAFVLVVAFLLIPGITEAETLFSLYAKDKYLVGKGIVPDKNPVVQLDFFFRLNSIFPHVPKCLYGDLWWSKSTSSGSFNEGFGNEVDLTIGCSGKAGDYNFNVGLGYLFIAELDELRGDLLKLHLNISRDFRVSEQHILTPYARAEALFPLGWRGGDAKTGALLFVGLSHDWSAHSRLMLSHDLSLVCDTGSLVNFDSGCMAKYDARIGWKITDFVRLDFPTFRVITPISSFDDGRKTERAVGGGVVLSW